MPGVRRRRLGDRDVEQLAAELEQAVEDARQREVGAQLFLGEAELLLPQAFRMERNVPRFELAGRVRRDHRELVARDGAAAARQVAQELDDALRRLRHFRRERELGERLEADELRRLVAQREDLVDERAVVPLRTRRLIGGARVPGAVVLFAQRGRFSVRHHGLISRRVEAQTPAGGAALGRQRRRAVDDELGQPRERGSVRLAMLERVRRVHDVLLELRLLGGELLHDLAEPLLRRPRQRDAAEPKIAQRVIDDLPLDAFRRPDVRLQRAEMPVQSLVLRELGAEFRDERQTAVERLAQRRARHHGVQVRHGPPDAVELGVDALEIAQPIEVGRRDSLGVDERAPLLGEQLAHGGLDVLRFDGRVRRQHARRQEWIRVGRCRVAHGAQL